MTAAAIAVREHPILFSGPMIRAILDGTKTQTRRVVMLRRADDELTPDHGVKRVLRHITEWWRARSGHYTCPFGQVGERLWVRETFWLHNLGESTERKRIEYQAGGDKILWQSEIVPAQWRGLCHWRPSIHMPRWASRLTLELTATVRVERVQDISHEDAVAEGCADSDVGQELIPYHSYAIANYRALWNELNAARGYGWDANPLVWVLSFARVRA